MATDTQWGVSQAIDQRQRAMMARIEHGIRTGQLTRYEANDLVKDLRRTELLERRFESDGRLGRGEAMELGPAAGPPGTRASRRPA
jgi:hypothetical protein